MISSTFASVFPESFVSPSTTPAPTTRPVRLRMPNNKVQIMQVKKPVVEEVTFQRVNNPFMQREKQQLRKNQGKRTVKVDLSTLSD